MTSKQTRMALVHSARRLLTECGELLLGTSSSLLLECLITHYDDDVDDVATEAKLGITVRRKKCVREDAQEQEQA